VETLARQEPQSSGQELQLSGWGPVVLHSWSPQTQKAWAGPLNAKNATATVKTTMAIRDFVMTVFLRSCGLIPCTLSSQITSRPAQAAKTSEEATREARVEPWGSTVELQRARQGMQGARKIARLLVQEACRNSLRTRRSLSVTMGVLRGSRRSECSGIREAYASWQRWL
jgi:hypothetical protein